MKKPGFFTSELKNLIERMLAFDPKDRMTIEEIK